VKTSRLEGGFYEYIYRYGQADEDWARNVVEFYIPYFAHCQRVLDIGCGRGQFIELLETRGIAAAGIDVDESMVSFCREKGLEVVQADLFEYLPHHKGEFDGIFCSNLIEHLTAERAFQFGQAAFEALADGGVILIATPNPESLIVHLYEFWRDPTHIRLYNRPLLEFLLISSGFHKVQSGENPQTAWALPAELQETSWALPGELSCRFLTLWQVIQNLEDSERACSGKRRWIFELRRRLARFVARTVMFEEFSAIEVLRQDLQALYGNHATLLESHTRLLAVPREVFVTGRKPAF